MAEALGDKGKQGGWAQPQVRLPALGRTGEAQGSWGSEPSEDYDCALGSQRPLGPDSTGFPRNR